MGERHSGPSKGKPFRREDAGKPFSDKRFTAKRFGSGKPRGGPWRGPPRDRDGPVVLYGWHSVKAALTNPRRNFHRLLATENAARRLAEEHVAPSVRLDMVRPDAIEALVGPEAVNQGLYAEVYPLASPDLE